MPEQDEAAMTLYTIPGCARYLGCSQMHVYRLIAAGELRAVNIAGPGATRTKSRIRGDDLARYIQRKTGGRAAAVCAR